LRARPSPARKDKKQKPELKPVRAVAQVALLIRAGSDSNSKKVGSLFAGSVVYIVGGREREGVRRVNVALRDNAKPTGWVTAARDGELFLDVEGELHIEMEAPVAAKKGHAKDSSKNINPDNINYTPMELDALAESQLSEADAVEQTIADAASELSAKLGDAFTAQKQSVAGFLRQWEIAEKGEISKMEFRRSVRQFVASVGTSNSKEIDALFDAIDADAGGSLSEGELRVAFQRFKDEGKQRAAAAAVAREKAARLRKHAKTSQRAAAATRAAEEAEREMEGFRDSSKMAVRPRLGLLLAKRRVAIGDVAQTWDADGSGSIDRKEFRQNLRGLGLEATDDELNGLFDDCDEDGGGELELGELMGLLKGLQEARANHEEDEKALARKVGELRKAAKQAQVAAYRDNELEQREKEAAAAAEAEAGATIKTEAGVEGAKGSKPKTAAAAAAGVEGGSAAATNAAVAQVTKGPKATEPKQASRTKGKDREQPSSPEGRPSSPPPPPSPEGEAQAINRSKKKGS
jgi:Ca2+-binding EF-hand superfamily protein